MRIKAVSIAFALMLVLSACGSIFKGIGGDSSASGSTDSAPGPIMEEPLVKEAEDDGRCHIGILEYRTHGASEETIKGFEDELTNLMGGTEVVFERMSADGDPKKCAEIATAYANSGYKLIFACGTEAVQNAGAAVKDVPIIGACVTDFLLAEVVSSMEAPGGNITGVSCMGPIDKQMDQITNVLPWPTKVGILYSGTETGAAFQASVAGQYLEEKQIPWETYHAASEEQLREQLRIAGSECSCLYLPTDSFIAMHMDIVRDFILETQIPVATGDYHMCRGGGLFCYSIDYEEHGRKAAEMAYAVLHKGETISRLAVEEEEPDKAQQYYNPDIAEKIGWYNYGGMSAILVTPEETEDGDISDNENADGYYSEDGNGYENTSGSENGYEDASEGENGYENSSEVDNGYENISEGGNGYEDSYGNESGSIEENAEGEEEVVTY